MKPVVHQSIHKNLPSDAILSQPNPLHVIITYFSKIHLNIILPYMPSLSSRLFPTTVSYSFISPICGSYFSKNCNSIHLVIITCGPHISWNAQHTPCSTLLAFIIST